MSFEGDLQDYPVENRRLQAQVRRQSFGSLHQEVSTSRSLSGLNSDLSACQYPHPCSANVMVRLLGQFSCY